MKHNTIDLIELTDDIIKRFNQQNKKAETGKLYSIDIKNDKQSFESNNTNKKKEVSKKVKVLNLYLNDTNTGERLLLYTNTYIPKNPSDLLTTNYKKLLYRELFYNFFCFSCVNLETHKREQATQKAIEHATRIHS